MESPSPLRSYYAALGRRAATDSLAYLLGKGVEAGTVVTVLGIFITSSFVGGVPVIQAVALAVGSLFAFMLLAFLVNLARAPVVMASDVAAGLTRLAQDAAAQADARQRSLETRIAGLQGEISDLATERDRLTSAPVPDGHGSVLRDHVSTVRREFDNPHPAFVRAPSDEYHLLLSSVAAHFPALAGAVAAYLDAEDRLHEAKQALIARIQVECNQRAIHEPPYEPHQVYASLWPGLYAIAQGWKAAADHRFSWRWEVDAAPPGVQATSATVRSRDSDQALANLPIASSDDLAGRVAELTNRVETLFVDSQAWDEFAAIGEAYRALMTLLPESRATARLAAERHEIRMTPDCPICADQVGQT